MPHYKNNKKNTSRKSNTSHISQSTTSTANEDDDWSSNIKVNTSRQSTPKNKKEKEETPEIKEIEVTPESPPIPEWEQMGISEEEYWTMRKRIQEEMRQYALENFKQNMVNDLSSVSYWKRRLERYERMREPFNKKAGWSAIDLYEIEHIDCSIQECLDQIEALEESI